MSLANGRPSYKTREAGNCGPDRVPRGLWCRGDTEDVADVLACCGWRTTALNSLNLPALCTAAHAVPLKNTTPLEDLKKVANTMHQVSSCFFL
ncbi:hypothetical protein ACLB2K_053468 [Fragaria x ananassa]